MAIAQTGGLDAVSEGPSTAANALQGALQEGSVGVPVTSNAKGAPFNVGKTNLDPTQTAELLANMQEMISQRTGGWNQFMSGLKDAAAWAVPGLHGQKALALQGRDEQKAKEMSDVYNMRAQMASLKSAQAQAAAQAETADKLLGGGAGGVGGGNKGVGGVEIPAEVRAMIAMYPANKAQILNDYFKTISTENAKFNAAPAAYNQSPFTVPGTNQTLDMSPADIKRYQQTGVLPGQGGLQGVSAGAPQMRGNAEQIARDAGLPISSGDRNFQKQLQLYAASQQPGYAGPPVAKPGHSQHEFGNAIDLKSTATQADIDKAHSLGFVNDVKNDPLHFVFKGQPVGVQVASAGGIDPDIMAKFPENTQANVKARIAAQSERLTQQNRGTGMVSEEAGKAAVSTLNFAKTADENIRSLDQLIKHAKEHPNEFNVSGDPKSVMGAKINFTRAREGEIKAKDMEESLTPYFLGQEAVGRRKTTNAVATQIGVKEIPDMFQGNGSVRVGAQISDLVQKAKGLGTDTPASTNIQLAESLKLSMEYAKKIASAYEKYKETNKSGTIYDMMHLTPVGKEINEWSEREYDKRIKPLSSDAGTAQTTSSKSGRPMKQNASGQWVYTDVK